MVYDAELLEAAKVPIIRVYSLRLAYRHDRMKFLALFTLAFSHDISRSGEPSRVNVQVRGQNETTTISQGI